MDSPATSVAIPTRPEDLERVRLIRRWSRFPPPHPEILALWHFWPALQSQPLTKCLETVRQSPIYLLGLFERRQARWWQIQAEERGIVLEIEERDDGVTNETA